MLIPVYRYNKLTYISLVIAAYTVFFYSEIIFQPVTYIFRDLTSLYLPFETIVRALREQNFFPHWNPYHVLGKPLIAEPLSGVLYPPNWLLWMLPRPYAFNLSLAFHHFIAALGMFLFLSQRKCQKFAALLGGILFSFGGMVVSMDNMPNALQAIAWVPLALFYFQRWQDSPTTKRIIYSALTLFFVFIGGLPEVYILTNLVLVVLIIEAYQREKKSLLKSLLACAAANLIALALAAAFILPFYEFISLSSRTSGVSPDQVLRFSFDPRNILGFFRSDILFDQNLNFIAPNSWREGFFQESPWAISKYLGFVSLFSLVACYYANRARVVIVTTLFCLTLLLSFGTHLPGFQTLVQEFALFRVVRYPEKFIFIVHGILCVAVAFGSQYFFSSFKRSELFLSLLCVFVMFDLSRANSALHAKFSWQEILAKPEISNAIKSDLLPFRIYSNVTPDIDLGAQAEIFNRKKMLLDQQTANLYGFENLNTPISVNLQDHEILNEQISSLSKTQAINLFRAFNVAYITSARELNDYPAITKLESGSNAFLYRIQDPKPRAYIPKSFFSVLEKAEAFTAFHSSQDLSENVSIVSAGGLSATNVSGTATLIEYKADQILINVALQNDGLLVVSNSFFPGWEATVDGVEVPIYRANYFVQGVLVAKGEHEVKFNYRSKLFHFGLIITLLTLFGCVVLLIKSRN